ncbi:MAG: site-specific DNA-methyltransferase [Sphingobium sp.]|uniref:DNA-methyltransferase n=1 Tax=Sphingobium sp. TaxID=1912891 RepID=UPI0029A7309C|nr:site-specific DNA-methyltransferase [Sphingobium sp.]MDX3909649.1 site-specific DNA-methyltransferase [Sphingobium sp.]
MAAGEMSGDEFQHFLDDVYGVLPAFLKDGALVYSFMDWRNIDVLTAAARAAGMVQKNLLVWAKETPRLGSMYRSQHELIGLYKHGKAPHINNNEMGRYGRNRANVLFYPGVSGFSKGKSRTLDVHPTAKTVGMLADILLDCTNRDDLVLDRFGGSGSTLIAAEKVERTAITVELDPHYADAIIRRFEASTGVMAVHVDSGRGFAEVAAERVGIADEQEADDVSQ